MNIRPDTIKLQEENIDSKLLHIDLGDDFLNLTPKAKATKVKINKWGYINKRKSFFTAKETINKMKRQPTEWEKILANDATDKGLTSEIHKQLRQLNIKNPHKNSNNPITK